jgi:hypothetical protein
VDDALPTATLEARAWRLSRAQAAVIAIGAVLFVGSTWVYLLLGPAQVNTDPFFPLADAFLHGRLHLTGGPYTWLEEIPRPGGGYYIPFPPVPAVLLMPVVAVIGAVGDTNVAAAIGGGLCVILMFACLGRLKLALVPHTVLALAFAFGSELTWAAGVGGTHLFAQVVGETFLLGALLVALNGRSAYVAGLLLALGAGARLPIGLALPVFLYLYRGQRFAWSKLLLGALPIALGVALYNDARFGSPFEFGYGLIQSADGTSVLTEPWYGDGIVSLSYLPRGLYSLLLRTFEFRDDAPWLVPTWAGQSVVVTMPGLLWLVRSAWRDPFVRVLGATSALVLVPDLIHGNQGFAQFGYRFILDALPLLWLMLGLVVARRGLGVWLPLALAAGIAVFAYGFWAIYGLQIVTP